MAYCSVDDLRAEGASIQAEAETRASGICQTVSDYIDLMTNNFFEPRTLTMRFDGTGSGYLQLPVCLIDLTSATCDGRPVETVNYGSSFPDRRLTPCICRLNGVWTHGRQNIVILGRWGYVDTDSEGNEATPPLIKKAAKILAFSELSLLGDASAQEDKLRSRLVSETTDGHSYTLDRSVDRLIADCTYTGIAEVDQILGRYSLRNIFIGLA